MAVEDDEPEKSEIDLIVATLVCCQCSYDKGRGGHATSDWESVDRNVRVQFVEHSYVFACIAVNGCIDCRSGWFAALQRLLARTPRLLLTPCRLHLVRTTFIFADLQA